MLRVHLQSSCQGFFWLLILEQLDRLKESKGEGVTVLWIGRLHRKVDIPSDSGVLGQPVSYFFCPTFPASGGVAHCPVGCISSFVPMLSTCPRLRERCYEESYPSFPSAQLTQTSSQEPPQDDSLNYICWYLFDKEAGA